MAQGETTQRDGCTVTEPAGPGLTSAVLNEDATFIFPQSDNYWCPSVTVGNGLYEPEIDWLMQRASDKPYAMLDCGANLGYWSVLASSAPYGRHAVVAIEASRANCEVLRRNAEANGDRFSTLHRAVHSRSAELVRLYGHRHYGKSLLRDWHPDSEGHIEEVETITIDDAADRYFPERRYPLLLKIDVEGSEIEAIRGARRMADEGALIIFEDHGKDPEHRVSQFVLALDGVEVWSLGPERRPTSITTVEQVAAVKTDPRNGYNFFAYRRSSPWSSIFTP
jgi:FkbM family methyltransferase